MMTPSNILVIDDDPLVSRTIERCLRGKEYHVQVVNTGVAGLKAARRKIPDLVLLDVMMPGMDGYTVCKEMREDVLLKDVPIIFLTAKSKVEDKIAGLSIGADDYLGKPSCVSNTRTFKFWRRLNIGITPKFAIPSRLTFCIVIQT